MSISRGFTTNDIYNGTNFDNLDDMQPPMRRFTPIELRSDNLVYQNQETRKGEKYPPLEPKRSRFCSKRCLIGLAIGLGIGIAIVIAIAVPLGVIPRCGVGIYSSTPNWIGTYQMDNTCLITSSCCCLINQITLTQTVGNQMQLTGSVTGQCLGTSSPFIVTESMPIGFQTTFLWNGETVLLLLGQDNSFLAFVNTINGYCSATAFRTSYNGGSMKSMNLGIMIFILLILIVIMKQ